MDEKEGLSPNETQVLQFATSCLGSVVVLTIISAVLAVIAYFTASWILWSVCCFVSFLSLCCFAGAAIFSPLRTEKKREAAGMPKGLLGEYPSALACIIITCLIHALSYIMLGLLLRPTHGLF